MAKWIRHVIVGQRAYTPAEAAAIIRESPTYAHARAVLGKTADELRTLVWRLREDGEDCGQLRTPDVVKARRDAAKAVASE